MLDPIAWMRLGIQANFMNAWMSVVTSSMQKRSIATGNEARTSCRSLFNATTFFPNACGILFLRSLQFSWLQWIAAKYQLCWVSISVRIWPAKKKKFHEITSITSLIGYQRSRNDDQPPQRRIKIMRQNLSEFNITKRNISLLNQFIVARLLCT